MGHCRQADLLLFCTNAEEPTPTSGVNYQKWASTIILQHCRAKGEITLFDPTVIIIYPHSHTLTLFLHQVRLFTPSPRPTAAITSFDPPMSGWVRFSDSVPVLPLNFTSAESLNALKKMSNNLYFGIAKLSDLIQTKIKQIMAFVRSLNKWNIFTYIDQYI